MKRLVIAALLCTLLCGCNAASDSVHDSISSASGSTASTSESMYSVSENSTDSTILETIDESDTAGEAPLQSADSSVAETYEAEERISYRTLLENSGATIVEDSLNLIDNMTLARCSDGTFFETNDRSEFATVYNELPKSRVDCDSLECVSVGDRICDLTVEYACCTYYEESDAVVLEALQYEGSVVLSGILHKFTSDDEFGIIKEGDVFFYPFPKSIEGLPLIFDKWYGYNDAWICDDENNYYMFSDTISIYLGNSVSQTITVDTDTNRRIELPELPSEYCTELNDYLGSDVYYLASLEFSKLYVQNRNAPKTGQFYAAGTISDIVSIEKYRLPQ